MATLAELNGLVDGSIDDNGLRGKIKGSAIKRASAVFAESTPSAERLAWARSTLNNPGGAVDELFNGLLGVNASATVAQIQAVADTAIDSGVNDAVNALYP